MRIGGCCAGVFALGLVLGISVPVPATAAPASRVPALGVLARGPDAVRGLPFFTANAIPALRVEYLLVPAGAAPIDAAGAVDPGRADPVVRVWCSREPLVLGPAWKRIALGERRASLLDRPGGRVLALVSERFTLFFELSEDTQAARSFATALERRFSLFFENAPSDAELSFPAFVAFP